MLFEAHRPMPVSDEQDTRCFRIVFCICVGNSSFLLHAHMQQLMKLTGRRWTVNLFGNNNFAFRFEFWNVETKAFHPTIEAIGNKCKTRF